MAEQTTFGALRQSNGGTNTGPRGPSVDSILNKKITITGVRKEDGMDGPVLWIKTLEYPEGEIRTGSKVLMKDAIDVIKPQLDAGKQVVTHIEKVASKTSRYSYYRFA